MHDDDDDEWGSTERNVVCACTEGTGLNLASQRYVTKRGATTLPQKFISSFLLQSRTETRRPVQRPFVAGAAKELFLGAAVAVSVVGRPWF